MLIGKREICRSSRITLSRTFLPHIGGVPHCQVVQGSSCQLSKRTRGNNTVSECGTSQYDTVRGRALTCPSDSAYSAPDGQSTVLCTPHTELRTHCRQWRSRREEGRGRGRGRG